jgi:hypothetical protein
MAAEAHNRRAHPRSIQRRWPILDSTNHKDHVEDYGWALEQGVWGASSATGYRHQDSRARPREAPGFVVRNAANRGREVKRT